MSGKIKLGMVIVFLMAMVVFASDKKSHGTKLPAPPKTWDDAMIPTTTLPLVGLGEAHHLPADYYYQIPVRPIYKSYPVYAPGKEPPGYMEWLKKQEPEIISFDTKNFTEEDWIKAGEIVFQAPAYYNTIMTMEDVTNPDWYKRTGMPVTKDGIVPFTSYVIRKKGVVDVGNLACAQCHTRIMPDGTALRGAQSSYPFDRADTAAIRRQYAAAIAKGRGDYYLTRLRAFARALWSAPWIKPNPSDITDTISFEEYCRTRESVPAGVMSRQGTSIILPVKMPALIGIKDLRYLDATGLIQHRSIGDLMRYAAINQGGDDLSKYGDFQVWNMIAEKNPPPDAQERYSDDELYAMALYIYSLKLPPNPNKFDALAARGQKVFEQQGCAMCHTPPLYTSNKLTLAQGFTPPEDHFKKFDIIPMSVGTDPRLAMTTRRGTGYYKVPSLRGVWARGPFEHMGSCATLEDFFDPRRVRDDYVPTGFVGYQLKSRAVKGHPFGLSISEDDRKALIAFLKTL